MYNIAIVIIFYNPTEEMILKAKTLSKEFHVYIVDNSQESLSFNAPINYYSLRSNKGIAYAQNVAIQQVLRTGVEFILFLDQDSCINSCSILQLLQVYKEIEKRDSNIVAVGPSLVDITNNQPYKSSLVWSCDKNVRVNTLICSGTLTKVQKLREVGLMDARLFIDYVDFEWCWRAGSKGGTFYITRDVVLQHQVGQHSFSVVGLVFIKSAPMRYYYRYRNTFLLSRKLYVPFIWKVKSLFKMPLELLLVVVHPVYKGERGIILKNAIKGMMEGLFYYEKE